MVVRFRSESEGKDTLKKLKKMKMFIKDMIECFEDKMEAEEDDEDYRYDEDYDDDEMEHMNKRNARYRRGRYRRSM
ncbi:MAG: hypothetical protein J6Y28_09740 [Acholeplasmatales bacterium]|nr:hypothetical protein [Acholeplasmatales bacterium]